MDLEEKKLSGESAFAGRLLKLQVDTVLLPDGNQSKREVVRHPGGVGVLALDEQERVLLVRQFRYPYGKVLTEIPAGKREPGEDPMTTGKRELEEETGYRADTFQPLGVVYPSPGYTDEIIYLYLATGLHPTATHPDDDEFLDLMRVPLKTLAQQVLDGEIEDAKTQIAVLKALAVR